MTLAPAQIRVSRTQLPKRLAGLGLWLDATNSSSLTFNGDTVSEWRDLSGRGRHFAQATAASQPDGVNRTYNGLRVIDFDGTRFLEGNAATLGLTRDVPGLTVLMVGKNDNVSGPDGRFYIFNVGGGLTGARASLISATLSTKDILFRARRLDGDAPYDTRYVAGNAVIDANVFTGVVDYQAAQSRIYVGGTINDTNAAGGTPGRSSDTDSTDTSLGARFDGSLWLAFLNGFIGELLVYRRVLSDIERTRLESYLLRKWNPQPEPSGLSLWKAETLEPVYHWSL